MYSFAFCLLTNCPEKKKKRKRKKKIEKIASTRNQTGDLSVTSSAFYHLTLGITTEIKSNKRLLNQKGRHTIKLEEKLKCY